MCMAYWTKCISSAVKTNAIMNPDERHIYKPDVCRVWSALLNLNRNPNIWNVLNTRMEKPLLLLGTRQNRKSCRPLSHAVVYGSFMNNAVRMRIGRWQEAAGLSFEHLTSEWTWTDCRSLLWQTYGYACQPGREPAISISTANVDWKFVLCACVCKHVSMHISIWYQQSFVGRFHIMKSQWYG